MAAGRVQITCPALCNCRVGPNSRRFSRLRGSASGTEEADAGRDRETSTWLREQVAVNITRLATSGARNSRVGDAKLETFEHAGEIVPVPAVSEYQGNGDCLSVLTGPKVTWRSAEQLLEVVVYVQLLKDGLD